MLQRGPAGHQQQLRLWSPDRPERAIRRVPRPGGPQPLPAVSAAFSPRPARRPLAGREVARERPTSAPLRAGEEQQGAHRKGRSRLPAPPGTVTAASGGPQGCSLGGLGCFSGSPLQNLSLFIPLSPWRSSFILIPSTQGLAFCLKPLEMYACRAEDPRSLAVLAAEDLLGVPRPTPCALGDPGSRASPTRALPHCT